MREINLTFTEKDNELYKKNLIRQGENLASRLLCTIPEDMLGYQYILIFQINNETPVVTAELFPIDGVIYYDITSILTLKSGDLRIELQAYENLSLVNQRLIKSAKSKLRVVPSLYSNPEIVPEDYVPWYLEVVDINDHVNEVYGDIVTDELSRQEAEVIRVSNENDRRVAEAARVIAEGDALSGRVKAEADRVDAEALRVIAEGDSTSGRVKAEADRETAEEARVLAEGTADPRTGRIGAELDRKDAEDAREAAELLRQAHITDKENPHVVTKSQVGLGAVDNTSDANKPISTAQAAEFAKMVKKDGSVAMDTLTVTGNASASGDMDIGAGKKYKIGGVNMGPGDIGAEAAFAKKTGFNLDLETLATNIKMNGTQSLGSGTKLALSNHVHPTDTSRVPTTRKVNNKALSSDITLSASDVSAVAVVDGKGLSTNDYGDADKAKVANAVQVTNYAYGLRLNYPYVPFGTSSTAGEIQNKTVGIAGLISLSNPSSYGIPFYVAFEYPNTHATPKLSVNGVTKAILIGVNQSVAPFYLQGGAVYQFINTPNGYVLVNYSAPFPDPAGCFTATSIPAVIPEIGAKIGNQTYAEDNYVTDGESLTESVDALDVELKDANDRAGTLASLTTTEKGSLVGAINEVAGSSGGGTAASTTYDNANSGLESTDVQGAIDEVYNEIENYSTFTESEDGLVPAPVIATGKVLSDDGTWVEQSDGENIDKTIKATSYNTPWDCIVANPDKEVHLCVGDSLTELGVGYKWFLQETLRHSTGYENLTIERKAHSGFRIWDMYEKVKEAFNANHFADARTFTVLLGTNDTKTNNIHNGVLVGDNKWFSTGFAKAGYITMLNYIIKHRPNSVFRIMQIPWITEDTTDGTFLPTITWEANREKMKNIISCTARRYGLPTPFDLYDATKDRNWLYDVDGLHFNHLGYRAMSPIFASALKQPNPSYSANREYMTGREYEITGATPSGDGGEWSPVITHNRKLTNGFFPLLEDGRALNDMFKYSATDNGGIGNSIEVVFEIVFGEKAIINDVAFMCGRAGSRLYTPDEVEYYAWDGNDYYHVGSYVYDEEFPEPLVANSELISFMPEKPFETRGLKIKFNTTFTAFKDWFIIGEITATKLDNYDGEIRTFNEMAPEE